MTAPREGEARTAVILRPGEGRHYAMGRISAVFKADAAETRQGYSISEWWLEPNTQGPGAHAHPEDDIFYVIEGVMSVLVGESWTDAPVGSFVLVPGGTTHDFENRGTQRAGVLNLSIPGAFEPHMPSIVEWFREHPPGDARGPASLAPEDTPTITVSDIKTALGNHALVQLVHAGWVIEYQYPDSTIDKGIDFDAYTLCRDGERIELEWDNWDEWQIRGSRPVVKAICDEFGLG
jgi:mannose-6-phosphate isomerase-like protein (cupin superfamily)